MSRPLRHAQGRPILVTDCDEVLLHMVSHFAEWLEEAHQVRFDLESGRFSDALSDASGKALPMERAWELLHEFFRGEMHRQTLVPGALEALERIAEQADVVILTNIGDEAHPWRVEQLLAHGIRHEVVCNQGGKGAAVRALVDRFAATRAVFVDDLAVHHSSVARHAPATWRLHMIAEPRLARVMPPAEDAHARIDDWAEACDWILDRLQA